MNHGVWESLDTFTAALGCFVAFVDNALLPALNEKLFIERLGI